MRIIHRAGGAEPYNACKMTFPATRHTLIRRLAVEGNEHDWQQFMADYWAPVCRFAQRRAHLTIDDAEDVAAQGFEALLTNRLLQRWTADGASKLRTLLCTVVRHVLGNRARVQQGRRRLLKENAADLVARPDLPTIRALDAPQKQVDAFHAAWVEGILQQAVESLVSEYHRTGKGDYFRVLYGRVCEGLSMPQISEALGLATTSAENYYKAARKRLTAKLQEIVRHHVERYCAPPQVEGGTRH